MTSRQFKELKQRPLSHQIVETLREAIITGQLKPGERILQADLAKQFGVSHAPLREALHKLEEEGFVQHTPYKGTVVSPLTRKDVDELRSIRNLMEEFAGRILISRLVDGDLPDEALEEIKSIYENMKDAAERGSVEDVDKEDVSLHTKICELSGHSLLLEAWNHYSGRIRRVLIFLNRVNRDLKQIVQMHEPLITAIQTRDLELLKDFYEKRGTDISLLF